MTHALKSLILAVVVATVLPSSSAQVPSELVGFNGPPIDDPNTSMEMFQQPGFAGSTADYIVSNSPGLHDFHGAFRFSGLQTEGAAAMEVYWNWVDTNDPDAWLRLSTYNGPERPNPSLHTNGQVRFKFMNRSEIFDGDVGVCLGIRETGKVVPQMRDGGITGTIEWIGVDTTPNGIVAGPNWIVDTEAIADDEQVYPVGTDIGPSGLALPAGTAVVVPGSNGTLETAPVPDDQVRFGYFLTTEGSRRPIPAIILPVSVTPKLLEWDVVTGNVSIDGTPMGGGVAGFTGNGTLDVAPPRGTLAHIAFTNVSDDPAILIDVAIDELQFEAPDPDPVVAPTIIGPILRDATQVVVTDLQYGVDEVKLYVNGGFLDVQTTTSTDDVSFTIAPADPGDIYTATQAIDEVEGPHSDPEIVTFSDHAPTIYAPPAAGADAVTVLDLNAAASLVEINLNGAPTFAAIPLPGSDRVAVPVAGLLAADQITARYWVGAAPSVESDYETVTVNSRTAALAEDFESYADQGAMEAVWSQDGAGTVLLDPTKDATGPPDGAQCAHVPDDPDPDVPPPAFMTHPLRIGEASLTPTETEPVVWNVDIYDPVGPDPEGLINEWVELNHYGGPDWFFAHLGMYKWINRDFYSFRANSNGGPDWVDLDEFDAPGRTAGWHTFTMVHKGNRIDVYVDGMLSRKNIQLTDPTTYARADIGGGYNGDTSIWVDDFFVDVGAVWFGNARHCPELGGSGGYCTADIYPNNGDGIWSYPYVDGDCTVNIQDLSALLANYGMTAGATREHGDVYPAAAGDGVVNIQDLSELLSQYGDNCN